MLKYVIGVNLPFLVAGVIIYSYYLKNLKENIQFVGEIRCRWNSRFEMEFVEGKIITLVLLLYLAFNLYFQISQPYFQLFFHRNPVSVLWVLSTTDSAGW